MILVSLTRQEAQVLDMEISRLRGLYGINVSRQQIIKALIEMHRVRLQTVAEEDPKSTIAWLWGRTCQDG